jgi:hypothetical protein
MDGWMVGWLVGWLDGWLVGYRLLGKRRLFSTLPPSSISYTLCRV